MPTGIHHFAIKVRDLAAAERFYCGVLGFAIVKRWPALAATQSDAEKTTQPNLQIYRSLWVDIGDPYGGFLAIELERESDEDPPNQARLRSGHHFVAFRIAVGERLVWEGRLRDAGVAVTHRTAYTIYFSDPEGNRLGFSHHPFAAASVET